MKDRLYLDSRNVQALSGKFPYLNRAGAAREDIHRAGAIAIARNVAGVTGVGNEMSIKK